MVRAHETEPVDVTSGHSAKILRQLAEHLEDDPTALHYCRVSYLYDRQVGDNVERRSAHFVYGSPPKGPPPQVTVFRLEGEKKNRVVGREGTDPVAPVVLDHDATLLKYQVRDADYDGESTYLHKIVARLITGVESVRGDDPTVLDPVAVGQG